MATAETPGSQELDIHQPVLGSDLPPRFDDFEAGRQTALLELALMDPASLPYFTPGSTEVEKILIRDIPPEEYIRMAFHRAFAERDSRNRPTNRYKPGALKQKRAQNEEVLENTIQRLGARKFLKIQTDAETLRTVLLIDETQEPTPEVLKHRAEIFREGVQSGKGLIAEAYKRLEGFIESASFPVRDFSDYQQLRNFLRDAFQTGDVRRLNHIALLTLTHEHKRALFFRYKHKQFTEYRDKFREQLYGEAYPVTVRDETAAGRAARSDQLAAAQPEAPSSGEQTGAKAERPEPTPQFADLQVEPVYTPVEATAEGSPYGSRFEHFWRVSVAKLRALGSLAIDKLRH